jgi:hypothetical protein
LYVKGSVAGLYVRIVAKKHLAVCPRPRNGPELARGSFFTQFSHPFDRLAVESLL